MVANSWYIELQFDEVIWVQALVRVITLLSTAQADHSMCSCLRIESMRAMNKALKIAHLNHVLV